MKLEETITHLKTILPAKDFIVTGSFVLAKYGLIPWDKVADLDIILIQPEISSLKLLNGLMKEFPAKATSQLQPLIIPEEETEVEIVNEESKKRRPDDDDDEDEDDEPHTLKKKKLLKAKPQTKVKVQAIFIYDKVKIDVFIENDFSDTTLNVDGNKCTTIPHIIKEKHSYGRMKDWLQCREMAHTIFDGYAFQIMLDSNWRDSLKTDYPDK